MNAPLAPRLVAILAGIIQLVIPSYPVLAPDRCEAVRVDVVRYVASQIRAMPGHLRLPYQVALAAFNWLPVLRHLRPFLALPPGAQQAYLRLWSDGPIAPMRDFVKLIRSAGLLVYYDHPVVQEQLIASSKQGSAGEYGAVSDVTARSTSAAEPE